MTRLMMVITIAILSVLVVGTNNQMDHPLFWLASGATNLQIVRFGLIFVLGLLLFISPPRHKALKVTVLATALGVASYTVLATFSYKMMFTDTISLILASIAVAVAALETSNLPNTKSKHLKPALN
jgi:hypothetical protein